MTGPSATVGRLSAVRAGLPAGALELATHAAVPVAVDAAFLNLLRVNFFTDPPLALPFEVEADLLASPLFRDIGEGLYEIDSELRNLMLMSLVSRFGARRLIQVAMLLEQYTDRTAAWRAQPELEHAQRLTALSLIDPPRARRWLAEARSSPVGTAALGREWFVAMAERLDGQPDRSTSLHDMTRATWSDLVGAVTSSDEPAIAAAVRRLGHLAVLPGTDLTQMRSILVELGNIGLAREETSAIVAALALLTPPSEEPLPAGVQDDIAVKAPPYLPDLLGIGDPALLDMAAAWAPRPPRDLLRVPFGVDASGSPVVLDLKEAADDGMGPHGILVGAVGSGKTELLRTLVVGLAATHSPLEVNFLLVDYLGTLTFAGLAGLPHTSAVVDGLDEEPGLVGRLGETLAGELQRRAEMLRSGDFGSRREYETARREGAALAPMPVLLVVCDEFNEMLAARPDIIEVLMRIGRTGRALGVHLLLASHRLEEGRLRGLATNLSYRIALRAGTPAESRAVIGVQDAAELPRVPGLGYLKVAGAGLVRFRAAYASAPYRRPLATWDEVVPGAPAPPEPWVVEVLVSRMVGYGAAARQIWLPPLTRPVSLTELQAPLVEDRSRGLTVADPAWYGAGRARVGRVDRPDAQSYDSLTLDLAAAQASLMLVGAPRSGKTMFLHAAVYGLALMNTPEEVQFYCLDSGGGLRGLVILPHVGAVVAPDDDRMARQVVEQLIRLRGARTPADGGPSRPVEVNSRVVLVVNGWRETCRRLPDLEEALTELAADGWAVGIHVIATASDWADVRPAAREAFRSLLELRLRDPVDSLIDRRAAADVPSQPPGRGLTPDGHRFLTATPWTDEESPFAGEVVEAGLAGRIRAAWRGRLVPNLPLVPPIGPRTDDARPGLRFTVGANLSDGAPAHLDFAAEPHALILGEPGSGRSSLLRLIADRIVTQLEPSEARLVVVDYLRGLLGSVTSDHLLVYCDSEQLTADLVRQVVAVVKERLPGPAVTAEQLRSRSWWRGPELFVLVDDYDLVAAEADNPLLPLLEFVAQGRDVGLHLVLAGWAGGAVRLRSDPIVGRLRDLDQPVVLLSVDPADRPIVRDIRSERLRPGLGRLVTAESVELVQFAHPMPPEFQ